MPEHELRVVFTGHTGIDKDNVLRRLCEYIYSQDTQWQQLSQISEPRFRQIREQELAQYYGAEDGLTESFLIQAERDQQRLWRDSLLTTLNNWKIADPRPKFAFLALHLSYQVSSQFFSPLAWRIPGETYPPEPQDILVDSMLEEFKPHYFVVLIDNVHVVQKRIKEHGYNFRLIELLRWRNVETLMTDILAQQAIPEEFRRENRERYPFERSPVVAIRHSRKMLHSFLVSPNLPRIYASFPISEPRRRADEDGMEEPIEEINRFREALNSAFTVFDPVSIDEKPLQPLVEDESIKDDEKVTFPAKAWWPTTGEDTLCGENPSDVADLSVGEIREIGTGQDDSEIDRQVRSRDYRLIDQSDYVVIYRPTYERDRWSTGTDHEARYAWDRGKRAFIIRDPDVDGALQSPPFQTIPLPKDVFDEVGQLNNRENQEKVLQQVIAAIKKAAVELSEKGLRQTS